jgi:hypothetical protein
MVATQGFLRGAGGLGWLYDESTVRVAAVSGRYSAGVTLFFRVLFLNLYRRNQ